MKRVTLLTLLVALMVALSAGVAVAALNEVDCPNRPDNTCVGTVDNDLMLGTRKDDVMRGKLGNDDIIGKKGEDTIAGGTGTDLLHGGGANDRLVGSQDGDPDEFYCDSGTDSATVELGDLIQTKEDGLVKVTVLSVESDLELITTCERITIKLLQ